MLFYFAIEQQIFSCAKTSVPSLFPNILLLFTNSSPFTMMLISVAIIHNEAIHSSMILRNLLLDQLILKKYQVGWKPSLFRSCWLSIELSSDNNTPSNWCFLSIFWQKSFYSTNYTHISCYVCSLKGYGSNNRFLNNYLICETLLTYTVVHRGFAVVDEVFQSYFRLQDSL